MENENLIKRIMKIYIVFVIAYLAGVILGFIGLLMILFFGMFL